VAGGKRDGGKTRTLTNSIIAKVRGPNTTEIRTEAILYSLSRRAVGRDKNEPTLGEGEGGEKKMTCRMRI